jgi:hypothetical protein
MSIQGARGIMRRHARYVISFDIIVRASGVIRLNLAHAQHSASVFVCAQLPWRNSAIFLVAG